MSQSSSTEQKIRFETSPSNEEFSSHNICAICARAVRESKVLNEPAVFSSSQEKWVAEAASGAQFPLRQQITDANQLNENVSYIFENEIAHHTTAAALEASVKDGCHLCRLLWEYLSIERYGILKTTVDFREKQLAEESQAKAQQEIKKTSSQIFVRAFTGYPKRKYKLQYAGIVLYAGSHPGGLPPLRSVLRIWPTEVVESTVGFRLSDLRPAQLTQNTRSDQTISQAKEWITSCRKPRDKGGRHLMCESYAKSWLTPTRLIDLSRSDVVSLRIACSSEMNTVEYASLSHCWGGADVLKLKQDNLDKFRNEGILVQSLPTTYRDAIDITRRLGIRYLWVDSLCIVQDSVSDWRQEASRMAEVYTNSVVTIAALAAQNSHDGCYFDYCPQSHWPCVLPTSSCGSLTAWYGRVWPFHNERLHLSPLLQRGWVMQERCLGKRMLYFGKFGVYWECASIRADEVFPHGFAEDGFGDTGHELGGSPGEMMMKATVNRQLYLVDQDTYFFPVLLKVTGYDTIHPTVIWKFLAYWYDVVESYSRTSLTFSKDKLVAFGGIIKLVQQRTSLTSLAGLWRELILDDLLWSSVDPKTASRPSEYRAPSFSWASLDGPVRRSFQNFYCGGGSYLSIIRHPGIPHHPTAVYLSEVVSDKLEPVDPTIHTGEVKSASLVLRGRLLRYRSQKLSPSGRSDRPGWSHPSIDYGLFRSTWMGIDVEADGAPGFLDVALLPIMGWRLKKGERITKEKKEQEGPKGDQTRRPVELDDTKLHIAGLVLQSYGNNGNVFRRVGMFEHCGMALRRSNATQWTFSWTANRPLETITIV